MNPIGALILVVLLGVVMSGSRRQAMVGMMCGVLFLSETQQIRLGPVNLFAIRILELGVFLRVLHRREFSFASLNRIDRALLCLYAYMTLVFLVRSKEGHGSAIAIAMEAVFCYFTFRALIRNLEEFRWSLRMLVILLIPYLGVLLIERKIGRVPFTFMSGAAGMESGFIRHGVPRCFGSFRNMDLLGSFGASLLPLYISLLWSKVDRPLAAVGVVFSLAIVYLSNSGGPLGATAAGMAGWGLWFIRKRMRTFRWGLAGMLVLLALVMKAPIWYVLDRVSSVTGGTGWHRAYLIDVTYRHLSAWWLWGLPVSETQSWFPYILETTGGADITNQFIVFGLNAGLVAVALLVVLLAVAYSRLGKALAVVRQAHINEAEQMLWGLGVALTVHVVNWFGISYYDQIHVIWFLHLAVLSTFAEGLIRTAQVRSSRAGPVSQGAMAGPAQKSDAWIQKRSSEGFGPSVADGWNVFRRATWMGRVPSTRPS